MVSVIQYTIPFCLVNLFYVVMHFAIKYALMKLLPKLMIYIKLCRFQAGFVLFPLLCLSSLIDNISGVCL